MSRSDILLIANNFPPVRGGSGSVYASLARCAGGRISILAPKVSYADGLPLIGWREHDRSAPFRIVRLRLLRTIIGNHQGPTAKLRLAVADVSIRARVACHILAAVARSRPRAICIGELSASGWLIVMLANLWGLVPGLPRLRRVVYVHGEEITTADSYDPDFRRRRRTLLAADRVIVVSRFTQGLLLDLLGGREQDRVVLVENGVDTTRFSRAARDANLVERYGLAGNFVFVTVCRLLQKKGVDQTLRAFVSLLATHPGTRYLIVGTGPHEPALRSLASELGIDASVTFAGNVTDYELVAHYRLGDVFVMPNRALTNGDTEGFGLVFLEANACGLPVIAGRDGGSVDAVRDLDNGLVVDGRSVAEIAAAMHRLRSDPALRDQLSMNGLAAAREADWTRRTEAFIRVCLDG